MRLTISAAKTLGSCRTAEAQGSCGTKYGIAVDDKDFDNAMALDEFEAGQKAYGLKKLRVCYTCAS